MWTVQTTNVDGGVVNATATHTDENGIVFNWSALIKVGDLSFVDTAKAELVKYQAKHKDDDVFRSKLETELNK